MRLSDARGIAASVYRTAVEAGLGRRSLTHVRYEIEAAHRTPWIQQGTQRIVLPISRDLILKLGDSSTMRDEQRRWAEASPKDRRWLLPMLDVEMGCWSIAPLAGPLLSEHDLDELQIQILCSCKSIAGLETDLGRSNWGRYHGRPVLIDYGAPG